ncbi:Na+/H+ antiporter [Terrimonas sp. NA20]|uniref:Na+/H+ antiporter n=1 Tax=Terrimonas ginsenosidimutans TaxID=2908004 RepID=A0ABS9KS26_9BACT|nr:Na+/H+ antiporter [Terrimonas ginsenosidimutans]MCG2615132.1 Na+/H+ antiporter [Terrimonas ginsenosidimutans]
MENFKIVVFILAILIILTAIANKRNLPHPVLLVVTGLIIGIVPQLPDLALNPEVVFVIILPPLLYDAAFKTSWHEFKTSIRPIAALAITLVFFTTVTVAITAHYFIPGFTWPLAFVLGAIVSPPDAVAASGIIKGLGLNRKVVTILEGESLVNDASALIAYRYAVVAVTTGSFVFWDASLQFLLVAGGGIAIGILTGYLFVLIHKKIENNPVVETSLTLLAPYISYLGAEQLHVSGVLAVVCTGLLISWRSPEIFAYQTRMQTKAVWDTLIFLLHGFVFMMIGLQLPAIIRDLRGPELPRMIGFGLLISLATILVRIIWVVAGARWPGFQEKIKGKTKREDENAEPDDTWKNVLVVAWTGTRGVISLAAALALPLLLQDKSPFPQRHSIIFLSFVVIFVTLVVQGLSLPLLIRLLKIKPRQNADIEITKLQLHIATSTIYFIDNELPALTDNKLHRELKNKYAELVHTLLTKEMDTDHSSEKTPPDPADAPSGSLLHAKFEISKFQRTLLIKIHKEGTFNDVVIRHVEQIMDIDEMKLNS